MSKNRSCVGEAVTLVYVGLLISIAIYRWPEIQDMPLNSLGDTVAGAFGPLAFIWLVLGYFQQGEELRQNTEALRLQAKELRASVEQQELLVQANKAALLASERPILTVSASSSEGVEGFKGIGNFKATTLFSLRFRVQNAGRTHAMKVRLIGRVVLAPNDQELDVEWAKLRDDLTNRVPADPFGVRAPDASYGVTVSPGTVRDIQQTLRLLPADTNRARDISVSNGGMWPRICVLGYVLYESIMESEHATTFGFEILAATPPGKIPFAYPMRVPDVILLDLPWIAGPTT